MIKNKKKTVIMIIISLLVAVFIELCIFQIYSLRGGNKDVNLEIYELKNIEKKGDYYVTTGEESSVTIKYDGYINELAFDYISKNDFLWDVNVTDKDKNDKKISFMSAAIINVANKRVRFNSNKLTINIHANNVKFKNLRVHNKMDFNIIRFILIFISFFGFLYVIFNKQKIFANLDKFFLVSVILIGCIYIVSTPISAYTSNDDQVHFHNMYTLLDGSTTEWTYASRYYDKLLLDAPDRFTTHEENKSYVKFLFKNDNKESIVYKSNDRVFGVTYNNIVYLPNAIVMKICKVLHVPFVITLLLSKLVNLIMYAFLIYLGIKIIPVGKKLLLAIGLLPTSVSLACQFSYDPTIIAAGLLATSILIKMYYDKKVDNKNLFIYILLISWLSLAKAIYCPLFLLPIILLKNNSNKRKIFIILVLLFLMFMSTFVLPTILSSNVAGDNRVSGTSVTLQLKYILQNPLQYTKILISYTIHNLFDFILGKGTIYDMGYIVKGNKSYLDLAYYVLMINILYLNFTEGIKSEKMNTKSKIFNIFVLCMIWVLVATALYLSWTPVGSQVIKGVQGRYFLPMLLLILFMLKPLVKSKETSEIIPIIIPIAILCFNLTYVICKFNW